MGHGGLPRTSAVSVMAIFVYIVVIKIKFVYGNISSYYYVPSPQCPSECIPRKLIDPDRVWEIFPCPPPWKHEIFLQLPWEKRLREYNWEGIRDKVASRCGINLKELQKSMLGATGRSLIFLDCDLNCFIPILAAITCIVFLFVALVALFVRRHNIEKLKRNGTNNPNAGRQDNRLYMRSPLSSRDIIARNTESVLADNGVEIKLLSSRPEEKKSILSKYYDKLYGSQLKPKTVYKKGNFENSYPSEDTSVTYSGTDTTHTYESVRGSIYSGSLRLSGSHTGSCDQDRSPNVEYWTHNLPETQATYRCNCNRCRIYTSPGASVYYDSDNYPAYPKNMNGRGSTIQNMYQILNQPEKLRNASDTEAVDCNTSKWRRKQYGRKRRLTAPQMGSPQESQNDTSFSSNGDGRSSSLEFGKLQSQIYQPCQCDNCRAMMYKGELKALRDSSNYYYQPPPGNDRSNYNIYNTSDYDTGCTCQVSEVETYRNPYWDKPQLCTCKMCSARRPDRISIEQLDVTNPEHSTVEVTSPELTSPTAQEQSDTQSDHRKRRRNKSLTSLDSSSYYDTYSMGDRHYRVRLPKTNGSLYKSKLITCKR